MGVIGDVQQSAQQCPCYKKRQDFQKLVDFKDFEVYSYRMPTENVRQAEAIESSASGNRYVFILHNKKDMKITTSKIMAESGMKNISCPRCKKTFEHAQKLMQDIQSIDKNTVMGICDHCRTTNTQTNRNPFCACEEIVNKFLSVEGKQKRDTEKRIKLWLSKIKHEDSDIAHQKSKQKKTHAYPNLKISRDPGSPKHRHEPEVEQMFYSDKRFQSDDTEMSETDLKEDIQAVSFAQPPKTLETSLADTPHIGENKIKIIPGTSMAGSGATIVQPHVGSRDLPRPTLKDHKQEEIFQYDIPSMDAKEVLKRRHDLSLRHMMRYKKEADDPLSLTEKPDLYDIPKNAPWNQKPTSEYREDSEIDIHKKPTSKRSKHDLGPGGTPVPHFVSPSSVTSPKTLQKDLQDQLSKVDKYHHKEEFKDADEILQLRRNLKKIDHRTKRVNQHVVTSKSGPSQAVGDVIQPQYSFYFPKEKIEKELKSKLNVSSTQLIKETQEKQRLQAEKEKKRKEEERQRKLKEQKKKLAREEKKRQGEGRQDIEEQKGLGQEKLSEINLEAKESKQKVKSKGDKELDGINKDKKSKSEKGADDKSKAAEKKSKGDLISKAEKPPPKTKDDVISKEKHESKGKDDLISKGKHEKKGKDDELTQKQKEDKENKERLRQDQSQKAKGDKDEKERLKQEQSQKGKEGKDEKERLKQEQLQKGKEGKDEKERLKQEQSQKGKEGKDEKERLKQEQSQKGKEGKDEKEGLKQEQLQKGKEGKDEKEGLKQEQLQKGKEGKDEKEMLKQEQLQNKEKEKELKEIDAASKKGLAKQDVDQEAALTVKKGEKEKESKQETSKKAPAASAAPLGDELQNLQKERLKERELKQKQAAEALAAKAKEEAQRKQKEMELQIKDVKIAKDNKDKETLEMVRLKQAGSMKPCDIEAGLLREHKCRHQKYIREFCPLCLNSDLELEVLSLDEGARRKKGENTDIIIGEKIFKYKPQPKKVERAGVPLLFEKIYIEEVDQPPTEIEKMIPKKPIPTDASSSNKGVILYALSDRTYIDKGWTMLPTEKVMRKMNVYRMRPAHPEFDWFEHNKKKRLMTYDTGERLAEFDDNGRGRLYYKNGRLALDYYDAKETNAQQRFVTYSSGEPDERGRTHPITILSTFDYLGNGIVFDHAGKIRLKYNQTEGVVLDRGIGPVSHWKWHTLNDPPVLQQVMIDTQMAQKDPEILKLGPPNERTSRPDNEEILAIEFENFIKDKSKKLSQKFKPFQIKMKALKINEHFSLKVLDQATVYLIFRDGTTNVKLNLGMILDHQEIVDTETAEVGSVANSLERYPARTESLEGLQLSVAHAQRYERQQTERERRLRPQEPCGSADRLTAAASRPMRPPLRTLPPISTSSSTSAGYCSRKPANNLYYNTRLL